MVARNTVIITIAVAVMWDACALVQSTAVTVRFLIIS
jgi:hypothetical protein